MSQAVHTVRAAAITICLLALVSWMIIAGIDSANVAATRDRQISSLIAQNRTLIAEVQSDNESAASDRAKAARNQFLLLAYTRQLDARQVALLAYLRRHGVRLPARLVTVIQPPVLEVIGATAKSGNAPTCTKKHCKGAKR